MAGEMLENLGYTKDEKISHLYLQVKYRRFFG